MAQETNLNVSPYFDDFDSSKNYYKVLFKPGTPIQARELNNLQSTLQYQIEQHGKHIFKEGSVVIPGNIRYDNPVYAVQIESFFNGSPISQYFDNLLGKKIRGQTSNVTAEIVYLLKDTDSERQNYTIYVKYLTSGGTDFTQKIFNNGETLLLESTLTYGNFSISAGQGFANTLIENSVAEGSAVSVSDGVYFARGVFAQVSSQTILLDQYGIFPSYKVGFDVEETIINTNEDSSLFDNSQGFSNFAAPGADRFKINLILSKREISDNNTSNFIEILRVENGVPRFFDKNTQYNLIRDELARRTFDESGDYYVNPFSFNVRDSLNDKISNTGIYFENQNTVNGNTPSENLMVYQIGPGKAYVKGYDVETISTRTIDVEKTRTTKQVNDRLVNYNSGSLTIVDNVYGSILPGIGTDSVVSLIDQRTSGTQSHISVGNTIGYARVYDFIPETDYEDQTSKFFLRLFDIQTFTDITLTTPLTQTTPARIKGKKSNAVGYLRNNVSSASTVSLYNVSGQFLDNEPIIINGIDDGRLIRSIKDYTLNDIKSIYSQSGISTFNADLVLSNKFYIAPPGTLFTISPEGSGISTVSAGLENVFRDQIKVGDVISYTTGSTEGIPFYNRVTAISAGGTFFEIESVPSIAGICTGSLPSTEINVTNLVKVQSNIDSSNSSLLTLLPNRNIASIDFSDNEILQRRSFSNSQLTSFSANTIIVDIPAEDKDIYFASFDEDRYIIAYGDGSFEDIRRDKFYLDPAYNGKRVEFNGLSKETGTAEVIATVKNLQPSSKSKKLNKTSSIIISNSKYQGSGIGTTSFGDGLTFNQSYGTRVQDEEISLGVPDVIKVLAVYESLDDNDPVLPNLELGSFTGPSNNNSDYFIGEIIQGKESGAAGLIIRRINTNSLEYVSINNFSFKKNEIIVGKQSNVESIINEVDPTQSSKNITDNFLLDDGQRPTYYDYSRIVRKSNVSEPLRKLKVVFQNYTIDSLDTGEFVTVNSYNEENYKDNIRTYQNIRLTDYIDIRPRVGPYTDDSKSPFEFNSRRFDEDGQYSEYILAPDENLILNYEFYVGRKDVVLLNPDGSFKNVKGIPDLNPVKPKVNEGSFDIATIDIPPYVFNIDDVKVDISEHRRYRMSDISLIDDRIKRVEEYTTLSLLEIQTETLKIKDAETGLDRFKSGFFVDNFTTEIYQDTTNQNYRIKNDPENQIAGPLKYTTTVDLEIGSEAISDFTSTYNSNADKSYVTDLGSTGVRKTGDLITLDYVEGLYYEQPYATKTESVTPFLIRYWEGLIELHPPADTWTREEDNLIPVVNPDVVITDPVRTVVNANRAGQTQSTRNLVGITTTIVESPTRRPLSDQFLRSRNIEFDVKGLKPRTRFYPFFEGIDVSSYIIPKLLEIEMISGKFEIGETVVSDSLSSDRRISFKVSNPSHKTGPSDGSNPPQITNPVPLIDFATGQVLPIGITTSLDTYKINPYNSQSIPSDYTESSTFINVDTRSLQLPSETDFFGLVEVGMRLVGRTSGAIARISNIRLISDNNGRLIGSLFIPNPSVDGNPRWINGENSFVVIDTPTLDGLDNIFDEFIPNSRVTESAAQEEFISQGTILIRDITITTTRTVRVTTTRFVAPPPPPPPPTPPTPPAPIVTTPTISIIDRFREVNRNRPPSPPRPPQPGDPIAQSFYVGEENGIFLTSCDIFFETKDDSVPVAVQIRPLIAGVPSQIVVPFAEVVLEPDQILTSSDGSIPTKVVFPSPVYLDGPKNLNIRSAEVGSNIASEYAIVILSSSPNYRVFVSELGQNDILTGSRISLQYTLGSLFKSQNGNTWSPSQLEDLKYNLYRADFVSEGVVRFFNPKLSLSNGDTSVTAPNQFLPLSKKVLVSLGSTDYDENAIVPGITIIQGEASGKLTGIAGSITIGTGVTVVNSGFGYTPSSSSATYSGISLESETGYGQGAIADITVSSGEIISVNITDGGFGYQVGDSLVIPESQTDLNVGFGGKVVVESLGSKNTFAIDNVQGNFSTGITSISYINSSGITTYVGNNITISSIVQDQYYDGLHMKITQRNHAMHSSENYVRISNFKPLLTDSYSTITEDITSSSTTIPVSDSSIFTTFEGYTVSSLDPGYVIIGDEVIEYTSADGNSLTVSQRGVDNTQAISYETDTKVYKYEFNGISLRRINKVHNFSEVNQTIHPTNLNSYHIKIDMSDVDFEGNEIGKDLSSSGRYFVITEQSGNRGVELSKNIQFESIKPTISNITPPFTNIESRIRTFTGQSIGGTEDSFEDLGFETISLDEETVFDSPRLICSRVNEERLITDTPGNRSFELDCVLTTEDSRVSPVIDTALTSVVLSTNLINNPLGILEDSNYADDDRVRSLNDDPHETIYISKPVRLKIQANSLKVLLSAKRNNLNDVRVLYRLFRSDSSELSSNYELFPGYSNYQVDGQGVKRVIDPSRNDGSQDTMVQETSEYVFKDYEYTVDNLPDFDAYSIKIVMSSRNQATPPLIKDLRAIATIKPSINDII